MFISVEDRKRRIRFSYNYSMSFTYSQVVITKQACDTLYTRSYNLKDQNMYDHSSRHVWLQHQYNVKKVHLIVLKTMKRYKNNRSIEIIVQLASNLILRFVFQFNFVGMESGFIAI